jgi:hypothetical protein
LELSRFDGFDIPAVGEGIPEFRFSNAARSPYARLIVAEAGE